MLPPKTTSNPTPLRPSSRRKSLAVHRPPPPSSLLLLLFVVFRSVRLAPPLSPPPIFRPSRTQTRYTSTQLVCPDDRKEEGSDSTDSTVTSTNDSEPAKPSQGDASSVLGENTVISDNSLYSGSEISKDLTPERIVHELDRYIVDQEPAKKALVIALRNRWRKLRL